MIIRKEFQETLLKWQNKKIIKVVTGVRRCGKSTLLQEFQKTLLSQGISQNCIQSINLDAIENEHLYDYHKLYKQIAENLVPKKMNYVFLNEIPDILNKLCNDIFKNLGKFTSEQVFEILDEEFEECDEHAKPLKPKNEEIKYYLPCLRCFAGSVVQQDRGHQQCEFVNRDGLFQ